MANSQAKDEICEKYFQLRWNDNWVQRVEQYERNGKFSPEDTARLKRLSARFTDQVKILLE
jgi:hypothetical protein